MVFCLLKLLQEVPSIISADLRSIDAALHRRVPHQIRTGHTRCLLLPPSPDTVEQQDTHDWTLPTKWTRATKTSTVENVFNLQARKIHDHEIARMFYSSGMPFHLARNPHYSKAFAYAANNQISGYQPPGYNKLRTTLLQNERRHVENFQKGVSIVSDGWSDPQRRSLINFMAVMDSGPMFLKAIDCSNEIKDKDFIAKHMREVIMEVGHSNVVQIVTNNAVVYKAVGLIIEAEFPSIYWTPCVVHTLNLALKNICAAKNTEKKKKQCCLWRMFLDHPNYG
ncbi:hypothetical protein GmHk_08G023609 [Glycine max]|nr:hypothetical protein GmHk_08G023609 [Glycine max]